MNTRKIRLSIFFLLTGAHLAIGQKYNDSWAQEKMWGMHDPDFDITEVPDKWKDESAVILCQSTFYEFKKQALAKKANNDTYIRSRIKLLDNSAVTEFTEMSFENMVDIPMWRDGFFMGFKIIKPDGKEIIVDLEEAVQLDNYRDSKERSSFGNGITKLAIPQLEVGDIIDYYFVFINTVATAYSPDPKRFEFEPVIHILPEEYPIVKAKMGFLPERRCYINLKVTNGAPEPVIQTIDGKDYYVIEYGDLDKTDIKLWTSPLHEYPALRYQVIVAPTYVSSYEKQFLGSPGELKQTVESEEYLKLLKILTNQISEATGSMSEAGMKFLTSKRNKKGADQIVEDTYYYLRYYLHFDYVNYFGQVTSRYYLIDRTHFIKVFSQLLRKLKMDHTVFIGVPRIIGDIDDVIFLDEIVPGIKLEYQGEELYIFEPDRNDVLGEMPAFMEGVKVMAMDVRPGEKADHYYYDTLPVSSKEHNFQTDTIYATIADVSSGHTDIELKTVAGGTGKERFEDIMLTVYHFFLDELRFYQTFYKASKKEQKDIDELLDYLDEEKSGFIQQQEERVKYYLGDIYLDEDIEIKNLSVKPLGRTSEEPEIEFKVEFSSDEMCRKSGQYLMLDAGKFISKNVDLSEEEKQRTADIYMQSPRTFACYINIEVPEGWLPLNLEDFNTSVSNETGGFISTAEMTGTSVIIETHKWYEHNFEPVERWPLMLEFLEAANDFFHKKMVFEKKGE